MLKNGWPETFWQDIRYAVRMLRRAPGFAVIAVAMLALGIGANSAIFSLVYGILLKPLPYPQPERIVTIEPSFPGGGKNQDTTAAAYLFCRAHQNAMQSIAADEGSAGVNLEGDRPERAESRRVTADYFRVLRLRPVIGRMFLPNEDQPGAPPVAVISYGLWQRRFAGQASVLGRQIVLGTRSYTIVGVAPREIDSTQAADAWTPLGVEQNPEAGGSNFLVLGRLKDGVSLAQANADLGVVAEQYRHDSPKSMGARETFGVYLYRREATGEVRPALLVLLFAVGLVLLIACANVANLLLARVAGRRREIGIRLAMGAKRARIARQLLTESVFVALLGGFLGLLIAKMGVWAVVKFRPVSLPRLDAVGVDWRILLFTFAVAVGTGILFGLAPAIQMLRTDAGSALQEGGQRTGEGVRGRRMRGTLVTLEFALSMILLIGAVLLTQTLVRLRNVDPGFNPRHLLTEQMALTGTRYATAAQVAEFSRETLSRVRSIPGVVNAAATNYLPLGGGANIPLQQIMGQSRPANGFMGNLEWFGISPQFFKTMGMRLISGRQFDERDTAAAPAVVIVNEAFARKFLPTENPIGRQILIAWNLIGEKAADQPRQIVGVVNDIHEGGLQSPASTDVFVPLTQVNDAVAAEVNSIMPTTLLVRTVGEPAAFSQQVTDAAHSTDALLPLFHIRPMAEVVGDSIQGQRFLMTLLSAFALLALLLAAIGVYGVMSYAVTRRTREIGIRAALGARPSDLLRMIVGQGMAMALTGLILGVAGALALTQLLRSFLYGVTPRDAPTFVIAALLLAGFALLANLIPALRAARLDPAAALRQE